MDWAPFARIFIRYAVGAVIGLAQAERLAADPDVVTVVALGIAGITEAAYLVAKRKGWAT
jgi:hypothetical protein